MGYKTTRRNKQVIISMPDDLYMDLMLVKKGYRSTFINNFLREALEKEKNKKIFEKMEKLRKQIKPSKLDKNLSLKLLREDRYSNN